ncbi:hypothetical protein E2K98_18145 [Bacillus salipaludis]|uniref:SMR family transporter n=1 Tax=Bacillus salipaludis TaxID=2547811 RepID=A0A4R5VQH6_9BACI|nr:SMR family transporter [Bacillus salipaludis]MDQ6595820.1 SMR family transporter [Bacillus salipaludis]TDK59845.1 hypothetical protein E2K98_18145 [Bacillus salipaludis]
MARLLLPLAGFAENGSVISLKRGEGFKKFLPTVACLVFGSFSFYFPSLSLKILPIGPAYAIWTGINIKL